MNGSKSRYAAHDEAEAAAETAAALDKVAELQRKVLGKGGGLFDRIGLFGAEPLRTEQSTGSLNDE